MIEKWEWIDGWEGQYSISNKGRVMSFKTRPHGKFHPSVLSNKPVREVKPYWSSSANCYFIRVYEKGNKSPKERFPVHILVAKAFIGQPPKNFICHHVDGDSTNNNVNNLQWVSRKQHAVIHAKMNELLRLEVIVLRDKVAVLRSEKLSLKAKVAEVQ